MRALVVYESMYGNTHTIAQLVAEGLGTDYEVDVRPVGEVDGTDAAEVDLLVVGGPTHAHGLSTHSTREGAAAAKDPSLELEPPAARRGVREWLVGLPEAHEPAAAFDTRVRGPALLTGRASRQIARQLLKHGAQLVAAPESFLVDRHHHLLESERDRARSWGARVASAALHRPNASEHRPDEASGSR